MSTLQSGPGRRRQDALYRPGTLGIAPTVPTRAEELEARALATMSRRAGAYIAAGLMLFLLTFLVNAIARSIVKSK